MIKPCQKLCGNPPAHCRAQPSPLTKHPRASHLHLCLFVSGFGTIHPSTSPACSECSSSVPDGHQKKGEDFTCADHITSVTYRHDVKPFTFMTSSTSVLLPGPSGHQNKMLLWTPRSRLKSGGARPFSGPRLWNVLPLRVSSRPTDASFRSRLKAPCSFWTMLKLD